LTGFSLGATLLIRFLAMKILLIPLAVVFSLILGACTLREISLTNGQTDLDFDGASNLDEFWTGTDPKNRESVLQVTIHQANSGELIVSWPSVLDRSYTVELSSDLRSWSALTASIQGTGEALNRELFREPSDKIFYRIRAE